MNCGEVELAAIASSHKRLEEVQPLELASITTAIGDSWSGNVHARTVVPHGVHEVLVLSNDVTDVSHTRTSVSRIAYVNKALNL
jgi:hypothetical protein